MNFFEQQERARKNTVVLIILFILCALCISTAVAYPLCLYFLDGMHLRDSFSPTYVFAHVPLSVLLTLFLCPLAFMTYKSIQKIRELSKGSGEYVIRSLHGRLISRYGAGTKETALLNVAEEIAVAFGIPPPPVYILDADYKINAFAAGFTYDDAVIGVTAGAIEHLTRQELQGVIAHEFSHILNGDMKLNTFAVGILNGILAIGLVGENAIKKSLGSNSRGKAGDRLGGVIAGIILYTIGYVGLFFGNLIKAAINREREFLADATAAQFTRYPKGLADALKKIGGLGSLLSSERSDEFSHFYFARGSNFAILNTHPPIDKRIYALDPEWDGIYLLTGPPAPLIKAKAEYDKALMEMKIRNRCTARKL